MKNLSFISTILIFLFLSNSSAWGQTGTGQNVTLSVVLPGAPQTITVNNPSVNLNFTSSGNYINGVHSGTATNDHITVSSGSGFIVSVKGSGDLSNGTNTIPLNTIVVTPNNGSVALSSPPTYQATASGLSTSPQAIITSTVSSSSAKFNIDYFATGGSSYINLPTSGSGGTYTTTITYSITPH